MTKLIAWHVLCRISGCCLRRLKMIVLGADPIIILGRDGSWYSMAGTAATCCWSCRSKTHNEEQIDERYDNSTNRKPPMTNAQLSSDMTVATDRKRPMTKAEKKVILASSAGTIFEWYDFYLYGALAAIIGAQFFFLP